ncbi:MAG: class I SAM-dependent methyltransferase [Chitinophagaceae bacterium]|jgi:predicted nicotinamide N-methyase
MAQQHQHPIVQLQVANTTLSLHIPDATAMRIAFQVQGGEVPYWSQVWPAAMGMCNYLSVNDALVRNKQVMEIAAGIGLPSFFIANMAAHIYVSDINTEAVACLQQNIALLKLQNATASIADWRSIGHSDVLGKDVLLLSDVNYHPDYFDALHALLQLCFKHAVTVILSTPMRTITPSFLIRLTQHMVTRNTYFIPHANNLVEVQVITLR